MIDAMEKLPEEVYHGEEHVRCFQEAVRVQIENVQAARDDLMLQLRPSTATWGLTIYEKQYGVTPDVTKPRDQRLSRWRAKRRGQGTTTKELIELMASSFSGGEVAVTEHTAEYLVEIMFVGTWGVPPNIEDFEQSIREVLPAHLDIRLTYRYLTFGTLTAQNMAFSGISALNMEFTEFSGGEWINGR